jgi:protocatechuate 3,4-dioxygenase beta subunit
MKPLLCIALLAMLAPAAASPEPPQTPALPTQIASLEGTAVLQSSGQPLSKVYIDLRGTTWLSTTTEEDGKFYFPNVQPGQYHLYARREGYALAEYGQRWTGGPGQLITLTAGQPVTNVQIGLTLTSVISGRISDLNGNPVTGARVRAMKTSIQENRRTLRVFQEAITNELGEYRLFWMAPGRYYVSAVVQPWQVNSQVVNNPSAPVGDATNAGLSTSRSVSRPETTKPIGTGAADDEIYIPIYFPKSIDGEEAAPIDLQPGGEFRNVDISVAPVRTYHVRGRIANLPAPAGAPQGGAGAPPLPPPAAGGGFGARGAPGGGGPGIQVRLAPNNWFGSVYSAQANATTGDFEFPKVVTGGYTLYTFIDGTTTRMPVDVRNGDIEGINMPLTSGVSLPVRITLEGEPPRNMPNISNLRVMLYRDPTLINAPPMQQPPNADQSVIPNLSPGDYRIYIQPLLNPITGTDPLTPPAQWQSAYVKSIRLGEAEVLSGGLHYSPQPDQVLEVVIGTNPGALEGQVLNDQKQAIASAAVVLFAESPAARITRTDMFRVSSTDRAGKFQIKGLPPGDYKVFAWEGLDKDAWLDPDFVRNESRGQSVHIEEGKTQGADIPIISPNK